MAMSMCHTTKRAVSSTMANLQSPMTLFKFTEVAINKKNPDQTHNATEGGGVLDASCAQYQSW